MSDQVEDQEKALPLVNRFSISTKPYDAYQLLLAINACPRELPTALENALPGFKLASINEDFVQLLTRVLGYVLIEFPPSSKLIAATEIINCSDDVERLKLALQYIDCLIRPCGLSCLADIQKRNELTDGVREK